MKDLLKFNPPAFLVVSTTLGFFALLALLFFSAIPDGTKDILQVMLGGVLGQWTTIISYHFGSSSGSAAKSETLAKMTGTGDGTTTTNVTSTTRKVETMTAKIEGDDGHG